MDCSCERTVRIQVHVVCQMKKLCETFEVFPKESDHIPKGVNTWTIEIQQRARILLTFQSFTLQQVSQ